MNSLLKNAMHCNKYTHIILKFPGYENNTIGNVIVSANSIYH